MSRESFLQDVVEGLSRPDRAIPGKYIWDEDGSALYDRICDTADYYPAQLERQLLARHAPEIATILGSGATIVEFGSGSSRKVRVLLDALASPRRYVPVDISDAFLAASAEKIAGAYPGMDVRPVCGDFAGPLPLPPRLPESAMLGLFVGNSVCNLPADALVLFLAQVRETLGTSRFLVGVDPTVDPDALARAYADAQGLMAGLHTNLLRRMVRELGAELDPDAFRHGILIFDDPHRVEARLVARRDTAIRLGAATFSFAPGEAIHTDDSFKYPPDAFEALAAEAGWVPERCWTDKKGLFSLHLLQS